VSNLSENVKEDDIVSLFKNCGNIARIFLAKDKTTGKCKVRFGQVLATPSHQVVWVPSM
jgi:hypothetical protein